MNEELYNITPTKTRVPYIKWRRNLIIFAGIIVFVGVLAVAGYNIWYNSVYSATISLTYAPTSATATINDKPIQSGQTKVKPGTYEVVIKKDGFATNSSTVNASKGQTSTITVSLLSNDASTADWYANNPGDQTINEAVGAANAETSESQLEATFPVSKILPLTGPTYAADYGSSPDKTGQFAIFITYYTDTGKQDALDAIRSLGYNTSDYEIIYTDGAQ
jgi:hypothetical protein